MLGIMNAQMFHSAVFIEYFINYLNDMFTSFGHGLFLARIVFKDEYYNSEWTHYSFCSNTLVLFSLKTWCTNIK